MSDGRLVALGQPKVNWNVTTVKATKELLAFSLAGATATTSSAPAGIELNVSLPTGEPFAAHAIDREAGARLAQLINDRP